MNVTHLLLISKQPVPNLTPLLDPVIKPDQVIMLVSPDMRERAQWLQRVIQPSGIKQQIIEINNPYDIASIRETVEDIILKNDHTQLVLNATGGTKPMSIAAYEEFRSAELDIYYLHPETDELIWMHDKNRNTHQIADRIKLENFLQAHGAKPVTINRQKPTTRQLELAQEIIDNMEFYSQAMGTLNYLAGSAKNRLVSAPVENMFPALNKLIERFMEIGIVQYKDKKLRFKDEAERFFVNGGWIEGWVYQQLTEYRKQHPEIQDIAWNIEIERQQKRGEPVKNEIDVAFLCNNRLYLIECKTVRFNQTRIQQNKGDDALYKIDTVMGIAGGLQARAMLLSLLKLRDNDLSRAKELNIHICHGVQLKNMPHCLSKLTQ